MKINIVRIEIIVITQINTEVLHIVYVTLKETPAVFHNGLHYDCHFIITELAKRFKREFSCLGENKQKHTTFSVPMKKEVKRIGKKGKEIKTEIISYKSYPTDSVKFVVSSLSNVDNFAARIHKIKCKYEYKNKKMQRIWNQIQRLLVKKSEINVKNNLIVCKCFCCNKNYHKIDKGLKKRFTNT